jgi:hypothetical protein
MDRCLLIFRAAGAAPALACSGAGRRPHAGLPGPPSTVGANRAECLMLRRRHKNCGTGFGSAHHYRECTDCCIME